MTLSSPFLMDDETATERLSDLARITHPLSVDSSQQRTAAEAQLDLGSRCCGGLGGGSLRIEGFVEEVPGRMVNG